MADPRANRANNEPPADVPRPGAEAAPTDSKLRIVNPDIFADDVEPNDESPTIISKSLSRDTNVGAGDLTGRQLAHFELLEPIGVGGMAAVLRARDTQLDRIVALKILPPEMARDPENIRRFHQEARAAARLDHENIARVFFCGEDQGLHFIAFEFVEGDNLRTILERRGRLPCQEAVRYVLQVAAGLEHAASRGVVHRDIKPSNIIITPTGRAKVVDMGLARSLEPHADNGLTQSGVTLGTFDYISPEQALEPREADCRSDIYSLGCTFYHMITGQAPVPEGTAAKKLQHHQHVAPADPRQLNPEIPDDVARILSKMMAKNPRDRYQRPIQLVQHLMQVARSFGDDSNIETMFVDVQVPLQPQRRPMLLVSLAILSLAGLLLLLSLAPQGTRKIVAPPPPPPTPGAVATNPAEPPKPAFPAVREINTEDDLQLALKNVSDTEKTTIALNRDISLTGVLKIAGTSRSRPAVEIVGSDRQPVKLSLKVDKNPTAALAGMRIAGANVEFKNVHFEIVAGEGVKRLEVPVSAVAVTDGAVDFDRCSFAQTGLPLEISLIPQQGLVPAASLFVNAVRPADAPRVALRECYFQTGQTGVAVAGSGKVTLRDCAFGSLGSLVQLKGGGEPVVTLEHCSAYLRNGPAFRIDDETACRLRVDYCVFSVPENARNADNPDLLRQTGSADIRKITYKGQWNAYHNLSNLWVRWIKDNVKDDSPIVAYDSMEAFAQKVGLNDGYDKNSHVLPKEPAAFLNPSADSDDLAEAFALNPTVPALRLPPEKYLDHPMIGIRRCLGVKMTPLPPLKAEPALSVNDYKPAANEKIVDPDHLAAAPGYYNSLATALADARTPGDIITLKPGSANLPFTIKPTDREADLTIRGYPGTFPTLTLDDTRIVDPCLFRLLEGKLHLENLNLVLEPQRDRHTSMALIAMVGNGACTLKNCTVTLKPRDRVNPKAIPLSVVAIVSSDDSKMMMADSRPAMSAPSVTVQDCLIRGEGDLVSLAGSRPIILMVEKSFAILGGSLLHQTQCSVKEVVNPDAAIAVRLKDSVFVFADPLLWLQAGKSASRFQHPLRVEQAEHCLFATLGDRSLASFEAPEIMTEKKLPQYFDWKGQGNAYVNFDSFERKIQRAYLLDYVPVDDSLRTFHLDDAGWRDTFDRDLDSRFLPSAFKSLPARPFAQATADDLPLTADASPELQAYFNQLPRFQMPKN